MGRNRVDTLVGNGYVAEQYGSRVILTWTPTAVNSSAPVRGAVGIGVQSKLAPAHSTSVGDNTTIEAQVPLQYACK